VIICGLLSSQEIGRDCGGLSRDLHSCAGWWWRCYDGLVGEAKEYFHVAKRRFRGSICKEPVPPGKTLPKCTLRSEDRWGMTV